MSGTRKYSDEQVELGLTTLALIGSPTLAVRELKNHGLSLTKQTLWAWAHQSYVERYREIRKQKQAEVRERMAQRSEDIWRAAAEKELETIDKLNIDELDPRDRSNALRNLSTTRGISTDVARKLRDEPDTIVEHRHSGQELMENMSRRFPHLVVDVTPEPEDAEVVEDEPKQLKAA